MVKIKTETRTKNPNAKSPSQTLMNILHAEKQKGLKKWRHYLAKNNPDLELLDGMLVVQLTHIDSLAKAQNCKVDGTIYVHNGHFYAKVIKRKVVLGALKVDDGPNEVPPQREFKPLPSYSDEDEDEEL